MTAFTTSTELFNYFRKIAQYMDCDLCFDSKIEEIEAMNLEGTEGKPKCLCKIGTSCPCGEASREIERDGECYCGIFRRK